MGQILSNLWIWLCPKSTNRSPLLDDPSTTHYIAIPDQPSHPITSGSSKLKAIDNGDTALDPSTTPDIVVDLSSVIHDNISDHDHLRPISGSSNRNFHNFGSSVAPHIVVQFSTAKDDEDDKDAREKLKREEPSVSYFDDQVTLEKNVTAKVKYVSSFTPEIVVRSLGPYTSAQRILLVGEGDFSFSASLAVAFGTSNLSIVATSLNSEDFLVKNYRKFSANKAELETRGSVVIHGADATKMAKHHVLGSMVFDRIIYNFPHVGKFGKSDSELRAHQKLVRGFLRNAKKMIDKDGEIHITSKSNGFFREWDIPKMGSDHGLNLIQEIKFERSKYPGYSPKYGFGGDKDFDCNPSKTYKFGFSLK